MKPLVILVALIIKWALVVTVGIVYSVMFFIYSPKAMLKEKKEFASFDRSNGKIELWETISYEDFWCPYLMS